MEANCGPSNALQDLSKHSQRDNTLQRDVLRGQAQVSQPGFRTGQTIDPRLNQEFQRFNGSTPFEDRSMLQGQQGRFKAPIGSQRIQQGWVQDFSNLSLQRDHSLAYQQAPVGAKNDWHKQFLQQFQPQNHDTTSRMSSGVQHSHHMGFNHTNSHMMNMGTRNMGGSFAQRSDTGMTEHRELHHMEQESEMFDAQFEEVEKELSVETEATQNQEDSQNDSEKNEFAKAARKVQESMMKNNGSAETTSKFQNSDFLKLMNSIGNRQVEIEGSKLVDKTNSEDARQYLSDPLKNEKSDVSYHQPPFGNPGAELETPRINPQASTINRPQTSHLPDPLAHIRDGELPESLGSLESARISSGDQVRAEDWMEDEAWSQRPQQARPRRRGLMSDEWQEVYDDYKHDDD